MQYIASAFWSYFFLFDVNLRFTSFQAHITQPHTFPTSATQHSPTQLSSVKTTPPPPPPRWTKPPLSKPSVSPKSETAAFSPINKTTQNGNITVTTTVTFCVNNSQIHNHHIGEIHNDRLQLTLASNTQNNNNNNNSDNVMDNAKTIAESNEEIQVRISMGG